MTNFEFSNEFDVLYNNITSNMAPGLNDYEKSVFLTKAQEELLKNYYEPLGNKYNKGLDDSPKRHIEFSELVTIVKGTSINSSVVLDKRSKVFSLPDNIFIILNETIETSKGTKQVVPISFAEYTRLMFKPYKEPLNYQAWRLFTNPAETIRAEIIPQTGSIISDYIVRYIRRPNPIILVNLEEEYGDVTINGQSEVSHCELNEGIHREILQRAVELAKVSYIGDPNATVQMGQRSE